MDVLSHLQTDKVHRTQYIPTRRCIVFSTWRTWVPGTHTAAWTERRLHPKYRRSWDRGQGGSEKYSFTAVIITQLSSLGWHIPEKHGLWKLKGRQQRNSIWNNCKRQRANILILAEFINVSKKKSPKVNMLIILITYQKGERNDESILKQGHHVPGNQRNASFHNKESVFGAVSLCSMLCRAAITYWKGMSSYLTLGNPS